MGPNDWLAPLRVTEHSPVVIGPDSRSISPLQAHRHGYLSHTAVNYMWLFPWLIKCGLDLRLYFASSYNLCTKSNHFFSNGFFISLELLVGFNYIFQFSCFAPFIVTCSANVNSLSENYPFSYPIFCNWQVAPFCNRIHSFTKYSLSTKAFIYGLNRNQVSSQIIILNSGLIFASAG